MNDNRNYTQKALFNKSCASTDKTLDRKIIINKSKFLETLKHLKKINKPQELKRKLRERRNYFITTNKDKIGILNIYTNRDTIELSDNYILSEIKQVEEALTLEIARYFLDRLKKALTETKTNKINDINLNRWKTHNEIITDSLWIFDKRNASGAHLVWYWKDFIPQILHQIYVKIYKERRLSIGSICSQWNYISRVRRLGRNGIVIKINPEDVDKTEQLIEKETNKFNVCDRK